jgi:hypothetical protein
VVLELKRWSLEPALHHFRWYYQSLDLERRKRITQQGKINQSRCRNNMAVHWLDHMVAGGVEIYFEALRIYRSIQSMRVIRMLFICNVALITFTSWINAGVIGTSLGGTLASNGFKRFNTLAFSQLSLSFKLLHPVDHKLHWDVLLQAVLALPTYQLSDKVWMLAPAMVISLAPLTSWST